MPLLLYFFLVAMLVGIGIRAISGKGLAITMHRSFHGPLARPLGLLFLLAGLALAAWLALEPALVDLLWRGRPA